MCDRLSVVVLVVVALVIVDEVSFMSRIVESCECNDDPVSPIQLGDVEEESGVAAKSALPASTYGKVGGGRSQGGAPPHDELLTTQYCVCRVAPQLSIVSRSIALAQTRHLRFAVEKLVLPRLSDHSVPRYQRLRRHSRRHS